MCEQSNRRGLTIKVVKENILSLLIFGNFWWIDTERSRFIFIDIEIEFRLDKYFTGLMLEANKVPLFRFNFT